MILAAISQSASALPPAVSVGRPASVERGSSGFASTLAAAQGLLSTASQLAGGEVEASEGYAADTGAATTLNVRMPASVNLQLKKALNSSAAATVNTAVATSTVVPGFVPAAVTQILSGPAQTSAVQPSLAQPGLVPALTAVARTQTSEDAGGTIQPGVGMITYNSAARSAVGSYSAPSHAAGIFGSLISPERTAGNPTDLSTPSAMLSESSEPRALSAAVGQPASGSAVLSATPEIHWSGSQSDGLGLGAAESVLQKDQSVAPSAPTLLANASSEPGGILSSVENPLAGNQQSGQANSGNAVAPDNGDQTDLSAPTASGLPLSGIGSGQIATASILNPLALNPSALSAPGRGALRFAGPRVTDTATSPGVRGVGPGVSAPISIPASALSAGSDSNDRSPRSPLANQTPFSIFFSGPGPGAESAASALPKMILPATSSAIRSGHTNVAEASSASAQTGGLQSRIAQSSTSQNAVPPNSKDSQAGTESGSLQAGQAFRRDADVSAASLALASSQTGAAQAAAPPTPTGPAPPLPQPTVSAEALPKPDTLPEGAPSAPASTLSLPGETPAAVAPGPVQMAQLINRVEQAEMRIGMNTSAFGSVEVRAVIHASDVGLVIGSEKGDLRTLLANDMPAITNTLQQQSLRLNSVNFMQGFAFSNNASGGGDSEQRSFVPMRLPANSVLSESAADDSTEARAAGQFAGGGSSLSILA